MRRGETLGLLLFLTLGLVATGLAVNVAHHYQRGGDLRGELGRLRLTRLAPETLARLESLEARVLVTYYVSAPDRMPSSMRRMERQVGDLLEAMHAAAPERFDFQIVDPDSQRDLVAFAARRRISPFRVREVAHDSWDERTVWSALSISYGAHPEAILRGIGPAHLPRLQATIVAWLDQLERPRAAHIALAAPPGFAELEAALNERGRVARVPLDAGAPIPEDADLLVWMRPRTVTEEQRRDLDRLLEKGGSVLVAGGLYLADDASLVELPGAPGGPAVPALQLRPSGFPAAELLAHFGLIPRPELVLDERCDTFSFNGEELPAPFLVRNIAPNQDWRGWAGQANGTLLFAAPTTFALDTARLRDRGWNAQVLATTSDLKTWTQAPPVVPAPPLPIAEMKPENGEAVSKAPLMVGLTHDDPWRGRLVASGADTPFADGLYSREHVAHRRLLRVLLDETVSDLRLVVAGADIERPDPVPPLAGTARLAWRAFCIGLVPLLLVVLALRSGIFREALASGAGRVARRPLARFAAALVLVLVVAQAASAIRLRADLTADGRNALAPETRAIAHRAGELGPVAVDVVFSGAQHLPPELLPGLEQLADRLSDLRRAGAVLDVSRVKPEDLDEDELAALRAASVKRFDSTTLADEVTTFRRYDASLRFSRGEHFVVVPVPDARAFELLEFHLAFALWRLEGNAAPHVAFASDAPRLSAAQAYEDFQQQGLFAPKGTDVYSLARQSLVRMGLRVSHVSPRAPELAEDPDALVWLQPRRSIESMLDLLVRYLLRGGDVLLAAQHFNIQTRQYRGDKTSEFRPVYWPEPQSPDVEHLYFPELSLELVREVLFDELATTIDTESQIVGRGPGRIYERQASSLPYLIRASAANFADSPFMRNLGDQAFLFANYLRWDTDRLAELGIRATPLVTTSPRTWTFPWEGGWVPIEEPTGYLGRLPLGVLLEGPFPQPAKRLELRAPTEEDEGAQPEPGWPAPEPGRLVFLGGSELFKDHRLLDPEFRGDQLLWNLVANLALPQNLATIATRRSVAPGFGLLEAEEKLAWRAAIIGTGPLLVILLALGVGLWRRRRPALDLGPTPAKGAA